MLFCRYSEAVVRNVVRNVYTIEMFKVFHYYRFIYKPVKSIKFK